MLLTKGSELARNAQNLEPDSSGKCLSWAIGLLVGVIKTRLIFIRSCRKNLTRIDALNEPKLWQFYRYQFFIALGFMLLLGATLSRVSQGNYTFLVAVAALDISVGTALLLSSWQFWKRYVFVSRA